MTSSRHRSGGNNLKVPVNRQIRFPQVRVLTEQGEAIGIMTPDEALAQAKAADKDLVLITASAKPPVVKIIDLAKFKYQQQQRQSQQRKKQKAQELKEVWFKPFIAQGDFETRLRRVERFLNKGYKVRIGVDFSRGRVITKKEFGYEMMDKIFAATTEIAKVELEPKFMGKKLVAQLLPAKKQS